MKTIKILLFLTSQLINNFSYGQIKLIDVIVSRIAKINQVEYEHVGFEGKESENYKNFKKLEEIATTKELVQLTENKNPTVACYASWALANKSYPELKLIFKKFILNDRPVLTSKGCIDDIDSISSELYHVYWNKVDNKNRSTDKILIQLDSVVLHTQNPNWLLLERALGNRLYKEPYKKQITVLAFEQGNIEAIYYLCNWHKAEYVDKIKTSLIHHLNNSNFSKLGTSDYLMTVQELFKFKDPEINKLIIAKMKVDRHWESEKQRFQYILEDNFIYDIYNE